MLPPCVVMYYSRDLCCQSLCVVCIYSLCGSASAAFHPAGSAFRMKLRHKRARLIVLNLRAKGSSQQSRDLSERSSALVYD